EAPAVLEGLRRRGLRLAVVSNSNGTVADILRMVGLAGYLDAIVDSGVIGAEKPQPKIFEAAAAAVDVRPAAAGHVGDLYPVDGARGGGGGGGAGGGGGGATGRGGGGGGGPGPRRGAPPPPAPARLIEAMAR